MPEHNILMEKVGHVKGKDVNGNLVTLERTHPKQLALFQTFVSDEDRYSNTIELYDAVPKYFSNPKLMASLRGCLKSPEMSVFDRCRAISESATIALSPLKSIMPIFTWIPCQAAMETFQTASKAPRPARMAIFLPVCSTAAARRRSASSGRRALRAKISEV
jgi:hypothetical protein